MTIAVADESAGTAARKPARTLLAGRLLMSFVDQGLNSLTTFVLSAALIATTDPATFGQFAFILTVVLVAASLQYGAIAIPMLVHAGGGADEGDAAPVLVGVDLWYRIAASAVTAASAAAIGADAPVSAAAGLFCFTYLWRETARNTHYARRNAVGATRIVVTALAVFVPLYAALLALAPGLHAPFLAFTAATGLALLLFGRGSFGAFARPSTLLAAYRSRFPGTGWTLATSAANEIQTRLHVFVIHAVRGADQLGLIEAARIVFAPLFLTASAWQRVGQPQLAAMVGAGDVAGARRLAFLGVSAVVGVGAIYCAALWIAWPLIQRLLFSGYGDVGMLAVGWAAYSLLILANWSLAVFLNAVKRFRMSAFVTFAAAGATACLLCVMAFDVPLAAALAVMAAVQAAAFAVLAGMVTRLAPGTEQRPNP